MSALFLEFLSTSVDVSGDTLAIVFAVLEGCSRGGCDMTDPTGFVDTRRRFGRFNKINKRQINVCILYQSVEIVCW